jgi:DMSO/TMAO reductase YedYZ molybdopterin-dependent catalytic subunit
VGNAEWTGVSVADLVALAQPKPNAHFATVQGADQPALSSVPKFVRSIPLSKLMEKDSILAWMMNREPLPLLHGGPLRLILPHWYGENWMKWLTHITLTENEDSSFYMRKAYRVPQKPVEPNQSWDSATGKPIEKLLVQSFFVSPHPDQKISAGEIPVRGKAFSGAHSIVKVEVSADLGKTWLAMTLDALKPTGGWQEFHGKIPTLVSSGTLTLYSRATDSEGAQQPIAHTWNPGGYIRNAVDSVTITVVPKGTPDGQLVFNQRCLTCHGRELVDAQRLNPKQWEGVLKKMEGFGVHLAQSEQTALLQYLKTFSPEKEAAPTTPVVFEEEESAFRKTDLLPIGDMRRGTLLFAKHCAHCHGTQAEGLVGPKLLGRAIPTSDFFHTVRQGRGNMPPFKDTLQPQELADLQSYLQPPSSLPKTSESSWLKWLLKFRSP